MYLFIYLHFILQNVNRRQWIVLTNLELMAQCWHQQNFLPSSIVTESWNKKLTFGSRSTGIQLDTMNPQT